MKISTHAIFVALLLSVFHINNAFAQRIYATQQQSGTAGICIGCSVLNPANAADGNPQTYSTLVVAVGVTGQTFQAAIFPQAAPANTPVSLKIGTGDDLLTVQALGSVTVQPFLGDAPAGPAQGAAGLATALNNNNQAEITISPTQPFDRIRLNLNGGLVGALNLMYFYDAYYPGSGAIACNTPVDELNGISSALLGLGLGVGGVQNPVLAIDGDSNTAATLNAGVGLLGAFAQETAIYGGQSTIGDTAAVIISVPQALVDAGVFSNISVRTFNGSTDNNDPQNLNSALVSVRLLDLSNNRRRIRIAYAPPAVFDRVQLRLTGGIAAALSSLDLYEFQKIVPAPTVNINGSTAANVQICQVSTATLTVAAIPNTSISWYTTETGGSAVFTGNSITTPALNSTTTYYVQANRLNCTDGSARTAVRVNVNPLPPAPALANSAISIPQGSTATLTVTDPQPGFTYSWYTSAEGGSSVFSGTTFTTPALNANTVYYIEAVNPSGCSSATRAQVNITVYAIPTVTVNPPAASVNPGQRASFTASSNIPAAIFNWYTAATGGSPIFTGPTFTTPAAYASTTYYAEAIDPATNAASPRASATVNVNGIPDLTISPPTRTIAAGQTTTFTATSSTPDAQFNWYTAGEGGSAVFTGPTFTTPALNTSTTYYAEAVFPSTNARSPRSPAEVRVSNAPDIAINPPAATVNPGQSASFTATSTNPGAQFNWYTDSLAGSPVFSGPTYSTPPVYSNTRFYAEAVDPSTGAASPRTPATVSVNGNIQVSVTPPTRNINPGESASFTASSNIPGAVFTWYDVPAGGTPIYSGATLTTAPLNSNTVFYVDASNPATNAVSTRTSASVTVNGIPDLAINPATRNINAGQTTSFTASSSQPGAVFNWYSDSDSETPLFTGPVFNTPAVYSNSSFYAEAVNPTTGASSARSTAVVVINDRPNLTVAPPTRAVNPGQTASFTATSSTPAVVFNWYDEESADQPIFTGSTFTSGPVYQNQTIFAEAVNPATNARSERVRASVSLNNAPTLTVNPPRQSVNPGTRASFTASSSTPGVTFNWYTDSLSNTPEASGPTYTSPLVFDNMVVYTEALDPITNATSTRIRSTVAVNNSPLVSVSPPSRNINAGQSTSFTAFSNNPNAVFNWYDSPGGNIPIYSGATYNTPPLTRNSSYYVEAADPATNARSERVTASVAINNRPVLTITPRSRTINAGQSTSFTASSPSPEATFNWYSDENGQTPVFTGPTFSTPVLNASTTFYAEAIDPATNAASGLTPVNVYVNGMPTVSVTPRVRAINAGQTASFTATSSAPSSTFRWYNTPSGGTPIFTGPTFTSQALTTNTNYYAEAADPTTNAVSVRQSASVVINAAPDLAIMPESRSIAPGTTASFTASSNDPAASFNWYADSTSTTPVFTGTVFTTPALSTRTTYYAQAVNPGTGASSQRKPATVIINGAPGIAVQPAVRNINERQTASFTASSASTGAVFNWYTTPTGGTPVFTGPAFTSPALTANTTFYVQAVIPATGAASGRIPAVVTVNPAPSLAADPPQQEIAAGMSASVTATSASPGAVFNWYTGGTGGGPIFTGPDFRTPPLSTSTRYYAEAVNPVTGAASTRLEVIIDISAEAPLVFVPNAFSPNGDGNNDQLLTYGADMTNYDLRIYNQWGQLLFRNTDPAKGWDGTWRGVEQPVGVYVFYLSGVTGNDRKIERKGTITLIR